MINWLLKFKKRGVVPILLSCFLILSLSVSGQVESSEPKFPLTISVFTESISLPDFRGIFKHPNWGFRIGTEYYYSRKGGRLWLQTINLGYYHHKGWQQGFYLSSEIGYRKMISHFFADATLGLGYLHLIAEPQRYQPTEGGFEKASPHLHKLMPALGIGLGYDTGNVTIFSRYEAFGEMPFNYGGSPVLPHRSLHLGTRFNPF